MTSKLPLTNDAVASSAPLRRLHRLTGVPARLTRAAADVRRAWPSRLLSPEAGGGLQPGWSIVEFRGREALDLLSDDWRRLFQATPRQATYHLLEAHRAYVDHLSRSGSRVRYLALSDGQRVRAICPLEARTDDALGPAVRVWGLPFHPHWPVTDVLCPDDEVRSQLLPAIVHHLRRSREGRQLLVVGPSPADSMLWKGLEPLGSTEYWGDLVAPGDVFDCRRPYEDLMSNLTKHFRRNLRSAKKKLMALDDVRFVSATSAPELAVEFESFLQIEASGWKGKAGTGSAILLDRNLTAFYRDLVQGIGDLGRCEINALYAEGRCIASQFCVRTGERYTIMKIGYDESYGRVAPGLLLLQWTLERCCDDPNTMRMDLVSNSAWQRDWHTDSVPMQRVYIALGAWPGLALVGILRLRYGYAHRFVLWLRGRQAARRQQGVPSASEAELPEPE